jgi:hypothetical protein
VLGHQPAHGGAVALVIVLLNAEGLVVRHFQEFGDEIANALINLLPEIEVMRVERVVEIEHPGLDGAETARLLKRTVADGLAPTSMTAKPAEFKPRAAQSLWLLRSNLPSRVQSGTLPP